MNDIDDIYVVWDDGKRLPVRVIFKSIQDEYGFEIAD